MANRMENKKYKSIEKGEVMYERNFDFLYAPSLQLYAEPKNVYKSVPTVNLSFAGYLESSLPMVYFLIDF